MSITAVFRWIYSMDFQDVLILLAVCTGLFCVLRAKLCQSRFWKLFLFVMLMSWAFVVIAQTIVRRASDTTLEPMWRPFQSYIDALKKGGDKELLRSNFMNVVLFYPAGLLAGPMLPKNWKPATKLLVVPAVSAVFSAVIEYIQYRCGLGLAQTDDVIHNALGALIGAAVILFIPPAFGRKKPDTRR